MVFYCPSCSRFDAHVVDGSKGEILRCNACGARRAYGSLNVIGAVRGKRAPSAERRRELHPVLERRQEGRCGLCGFPIDDPRFDPANLDHIIPYFEGGPSHRLNLRLTHRRCNQERGHQQPPKAHADAIWEAIETGSRAECWLDLGIPMPPPPWMPPE